jgi:NADPH-dependent 2,4-dienoyl-CoA reductase/sulfur reductase-like enzyme
VGKAELAIIGGGPGGIATAVEAAKQGVRVTLLDENARVGGQIFRQLEKGFTPDVPEAMGKNFQKGKELFKEFKLLENKITYLNSATVWGIFDNNRIAYGRNGESKTLESERLLIAAGAYDRPIPFPGWTLPGVLTAGGAQKLVKIDRIIPGEKILLAGTGPLQLVLAHQLIRAGANITAVLEAGGFKGKWLKLMQGMWGNWDYMGDGLRYLRRIHKAGIPLMQGHMITQARGGGRVEEAVIAKVDKDWRHIPGTEQTITADTVCLGYGLVTSTELTRLAECDHEYDIGLGGYVPVRSKSMETTKQGIYAVGDGAGVAGSKVAILEGRIAGIAIASSLGYVSRKKRKSILAGYNNSLARHTRLRNVLDEITRPRPGLYELADDETIICRCEDVTFKDIKDLVKKKGIKAKDIKRKTRIGMGSCGGRMCGPTIIELLNNMNKAESKPPAGLNCRPPIKPIPIGVLAGKGDADKPNNWGTPTAAKHKGGNWHGSKRS